MKIGYVKLGRSMPLTLDKCGNVGGDVECVPILKHLAASHPEDDFILVGRNSGENPQDVGLPANVSNPWTDWSPELRKRRELEDLRTGNLSIERHIALNKIFDDITLDTFRDLDAIICWIGQHGTTNMPLPGTRKDGLTKPHDWCALYAGYVLRGINAFRDKDPWKFEEVNLNSDTRNTHKMRDLKWPMRHPVLTQYTFTKNIKLSREGDDSQFNLWNNHGYANIGDPGDENKLWLSKINNVYSRVELNSLMPNAPFGQLIQFNDEWEGRYHFGVFINENRKYVRTDLQRLTAMKDWILPLNPAWIHGTWSKESLEELNLEITPIGPSEYFNQFVTARCTFTTPASGSGWATAKPWEAFASGVACFFHPEYDTQNNILGDADHALREYLRVKTPEELQRRVVGLNRDRDAWSWVINQQRAHFDKAVREERHIKMIESRVWGE